MCGRESMRVRSRPARARALVWRPGKGVGWRGGVKMRGGGVGGGRVLGRRCVSKRAGRRSLSHMRAGSLASLAFVCVCVRARTGLDWTTGAWHGALAQADAPLRGWVIIGTCDAAVADEDTDL